MSASPLIPSADPCCSPCEEPTTTLLPGPQGDPGSDGTDGTDGIDAFTTASSFIMPGEGLNVTVTVANSEWMAAGQTVWAKGGGSQGTFEVQSKPTTTSVILKNLEDTANDLYPENSPPATVFPGGSSIVAIGRQGAAGSDASAGAPTNATYITQTPNGSLSSEQPLSALATGILKSTTGTGILSIAAAGTDYLAPAAIGVTVQAFDAGLASFAAIPTAADKMAYSTAANVWAETDLSSFIRTLLDDATAAAAQATLRAYAVNEGIIGALGSVNFNSSGDNVMAIANAAAGYLIESIVVFQASTSLTTATVGVFTGAGGGGVQLAADQSLAALTGAFKFKKLTLEAICGTDWRIDTPLYIRVGTPQGAAAIGAVFVFGKILSV